MSSAPGLKAICPTCKQPHSVRFVEGRWEMRHHEIFIYDEGRKVCDGVEQPVPESEIRAWLDRELNALHEEHRKAQETYQRACKKISDARSELFALMQKNGVRSGHEGPEKKGLPE